MARPRGARSTLIALNYDVIAELAGSITGDTARQYARRGEYDSRNLESVLCWVNSRRRAKGLPLIGLRTKVGEAVSDEDSEAVTSMPAPVGIGSLLIYNPLTACYREDI